MAEIRIKKVVLPILNNSSNEAEFFILTSTNPKKSRNSIKVKHYATNEAAKKS
jgi:hypothetical protein